MTQRQKDKMKAGKIAAKHNQMLYLSRVEECVKKIVRQHADGGYPYAFYWGYIHRGNKRFKTCLTGSIAHSDITGLMRLIESEMGGLVTGVWCNLD